MEISPERIGRREWWLWLSALGVTTLSGAAFLLSSFPSLFLRPEHFYEIRSEQARWATFCLLLLFNGWLVYRQWSFRRLRRQLAGPDVDAQTNTEVAYDPSSMDDVTGLYTRASLDHRLGKEVARAKRHSLPLTLVALHLDDFAHIVEQFGKPASDTLLKEFADLLRKSSRGCDLAARMATDDFLLVLPECSLQDAKIVTDRLGNPELQCAGQTVTLECSIGWVDYKSGDVPSDLIKRAQDVLQLYKKASQDNSSATLTIR